MKSLRAIVDEGSHCASSPPLGGGGPDAGYNNE